MKRTLFLLLLFVSTMTQAQMHQSGFVTEQGYQNGFDLHDINRYPLSSVEASRFQNSLSFTTETKNVTRWVDRINNMPEYLANFYYKYGEMVKDVLNGGENVLSNPSLGVYLNGQNSYNIVMRTFTGTVNFEYPADATSEIIKQVVSEAVKEEVLPQWNEFNTFIKYLIICLNYDYAEGFWVDSYYRWCNSYSYRYQYSKGTGTATYERTVYFTVKAEDYDFRRTEFQNPDILSETVGEFKQKVQDVLYGRPANGTRYENIAYLNDWLTKHNCYNSDLGYTDNVARIAWSPLSALRGSTGSNGPVCEGYSRAFKVLCDQLDIPCMLAVGYAKGSPAEEGEGHMWNEVQMENGLWYAVDVTWNDPVGARSNPAVSGFENEKWLLLGSDDYVAPNFTFSQSHPLSISAWNITDEVLNTWDISVASLITHHKYDSSTSIANIRTTAKQLDRSYNLGGQLSCGRSPRIVVSNGRKLVVR